MRQISKIEFFNQSLSYHNYRIRYWYWVAFGIPAKNDFDLINEKFKLPFIPFKDHDGFKCLDENKVLVLIDSKDEYILNISDIVTLKPENTILVKDEVKTTVGNAILNKLLFEDCFGDKIPFQPKEDWSISSIEDDYIAPGLVSGTITVDEQNKFSNRIKFCNGLSQLFVVTMTERNLSTPPDFLKLKAEIVKKYADPVTGKVTSSKDVIAIEDELKKIYDDYIKDDPSYGKFMSGFKVKEVSAKKMLLSAGAGQDPNDPDKIIYVDKALQEGWPEDNDALVMMFNEIRYSSYARGKETMYGGEIAKLVLGALNTYEITSGDCGSTLGMKHIITNKTKKSFIGLYYNTPNGPKEITKENMESLLDKEISIRSLMFCLEGGETEDRVCSTCAGKFLSLKKHGIVYAVTSLTSTVTKSSLKVMHGQRMDIVKNNIPELLT